MTILLITLLTVLIPGLVVGFSVYRWPRAKLTAPSISVDKVQKEAHKHRRFIQFLRSRFSPDSATGLLLTAALIAVILGTALVALILVMIHTHSGFARFDRSASLYGAHHATHLSTHVLQIFTQLGGAVLIIPLTIIVAVVETIRQRSWAIVTFLVLVVAGQFLVANIIKTLVDRARPHFDQLTGFSGSSFPSGHAAAASACFAAYALVLGRRRSLSTRAWLAGLAAGLAGGIACCRVMLGVHWLTDVLGGLSLGWAWFALCSIAFGGYQLRFGAPTKTAEASVAPEPH